MSTNKKITSVGDSEKPSNTNSNYTFVPTEENKGKATQFRMFAVLLWLGAIVAQVFAIRMFLSAVNSEESPINAWVIGLIVLDLILVFVGSLLWKKSNRLDPPSEKNQFLFYVQNQLGVIMAFVAFLPLIIFILTNKKVDGKSKAILAMPLTDSMSLKYSATIKRVSDKNQNSNNKANAEELVYLSQFKKDITDKKESKPVVVDKGDKVQFYYPIPTNTMCLQCHGKTENIKPEVLKKIKALYPADLAIGYGENEVRGIWSITFNK